MTLYRRPWMVAFFSFAMTALPATSQQVCQTLLQGGIFDTNVTTNETFASDYLRSLYCSSGSSSSNTDLSVGLPIGKIPVQFGLSSGSDSSHNICDDRTSSFEDWQRFLGWSRTASPIIAKAFVDCIKAEGTQLWTERSQVTNAFSVNARIHYATKEFPPVRFQFSFTPSNAVGKCGPKSKADLEKGIQVGNFETFKVVCELASRTAGVEIGLVASSSIPYGTMSVRPYRPGPLFALSTTTSARSGVKTPNPGDATYGWGGDTLLDRYDGQNIVGPTDGRRWATWHLDNLTPGLYRVYVTYAAETSRPLRLRVDGNTVLEGVASETTGGWAPSMRQQRSAGQVRIDRSSVELKLETMELNQSWPHFKELRLVFAGD